MASIILDCPPFNHQSSDLNDSPPTEVPVNAEPQPAPELNGTQVAIQGTSNGLDTASGQSEDLANLKELLCGTWSAPGPTSAGSKEICLREKSAGYKSHIAQNDCNEALYPGSRRGINGETPILLDDPSSEDKDALDSGREGGSSSEVHGHNGSTLEEHERKHSGERAEEEGPLSTPGPSNLDVRESALFENTQNSSSDAPPPPPPPPSPPLPPPADTVLTSTSNIQTESSEGPLQDIGLRPSDEGEEKADTDDGHNGDGDGRIGDRMAKGATGVTGIRDPSKRTADDVGLNEGPEGVPRSEKVRRIDPTDGTDDADEGMSDLELARLRSLPTPVFRMPPSWRDFQQREDTTSSSRSSGAGDSQDDPLVIEDDGGKTGESTASTRATTAEPEIEIAHLLSSPPKEEPKTLGASNAPAGPDPPVELLARPTSPKVAPPPHSDGWVVDKDEHGAPAVPSPRSATTPPLSQQSEAPSSALEEEWEIRKIIGKRRAGKGYEYRVRWRGTWLPRSELGNARRLLQEFEARSRSQRDDKGGKPSCADRGL